MDRLRCTIKCHGSIDTKRTRETATYRRPSYLSEDLVPWIAFAVHFIAAALFTNSIPHITNGLSGRRFRTPFARLRGMKLSSPVTNVLWGWSNMLVALLLFVNIGPLYIVTPIDMVVIAASVLLTSAWLAQTFERDHA